MLNLEEGIKLVRLARKAVEANVSAVPFLPDKQLEEEFSTLGGCFVTLHKGGQLRGCVGFPEPRMPLYEAVINAAQDVTYRDFRFQPVEAGELPEICIEVDVLTQPEQVRVDSPEEYEKHIQVGRDGLIVRKENTGGLLLPQVATRYDWDVFTFLSRTCNKAGLKEDEWENIDKVKIFKFQSQNFAESTPNGEITDVTPVHS